MRIVISLCEDALPILVVKNSSVLLAIIGTDTGSVLSFACIFIISFHTRTVILAKTTIFLIPLTICCKYWICILSEAHSDIVGFFTIQRPNTSSIFVHIYVCRGLRLHFCDLQWYFEFCILCAEMLDWRKVQKYEEEKVVT